MESRQYRRRVRLIAQQGGLCPLCGRGFTADERRESTFDHIRPRSHGGGNGLDNLQVVHGPCNARKADACPGCPACAGETETPHP